MDESVQIQQYVGVQIIDYVYCEDSCSFLYPIDMGEVIAFQGPKQMDCLLIVVILEDLLYKLLNFYFFFFDHIIDNGLHPRKVSVHIAALLAFHVLSAI